MTASSHSEVVERLTEAQREALMPGSYMNRRGLVALGLAHWKQRPGQRVKSLMPTPLGYAVRDHLLSSTEKMK